MSSTPQTLIEEGQSKPLAKPCILVIFGATGDLTARKLLPALYSLNKNAELPTQFACVGFARREKSHEQFREEMRSSVEKFSRVPLTPPLWESFQEQIFYHRSEFDNDEGYKKLKTLLDDLDQKLGTKGNRVFYLSTQPSFFPTICKKLHQFGLTYNSSKVKNKWSRVIIEKPFGHDLKSAQALQKELLSYLDETQIYRIDHYLGKETVQNLLVFRFANSIFESLWNNRYIDHVQITVSEELGIGTRGRFWEEAGLLRDIVQNHMMQLLSLVAMEPPISLKASAIHDEKVKVLQSIRLLYPGELENSVIRGQYGRGFINAEEVKGYREEENVDPNSSRETYVAMRLFIENWRWDGVPFYLRGGKRLPKRATEIAVTFKEPPSVLFQTSPHTNEPNVLAIRIQPDEGSSLKVNCKVPGSSNFIQPVKMDFRYGSYFGMSPPEAYERLICDCMAGDQTLFARDDEVISSWRLCTPILDYWESQKAEEFPNYQAGTWGPKSADEMIMRDNRKWRLI